MAQVHPTVREPQPKRRQIRTVEPVLRDPPLWVPPPSSRAADILGRIEYFGFGVLIVALLAVLPVVLLLSPASETNILDEDALAALLTTEQTSAEPSGYTSDYISAPETKGITLTVDSAPGGAVVLVDYDSIGVTPVVGHRLKAGVYVLSMRKKGYAPLDTVLFVDERASDPVLSIPLRPLERSRGGAAVSEAVSIANAQRAARQRQQAEELRLRAQQSDPDAEQADQISRRERAARAEQREAPSDTVVRSEPAVSTGTVTVLVRPWGSIYIDGTLHQRESDIQYTATLPAGRHHVRIEHPTLGTREKDVEIDAGRPVNLVFDLLPRNGAGNGN